VPESTRTISASISISGTHWKYLCSKFFSSAAITQLKKLDVIQRKAARIIYKVPQDANAEILLLFLKLDALSHRREAHLVKLIKLFLSGKCHSAIPSLVEVCSDETLLVFQSKTTLGMRPPSVFGANLYNQHLAFCSDSEDMDTLFS